VVDGSAVRWEGGGSPFLVARSRSRGLWELGSEL